MNLKGLFSYGMFFAIAFSCLGQDWQSFNFPVEGQMADGVFWGDTGVIITTLGYIIKTNNFGKTWTIDSSYANLQFSTMCFPTRETGYIASPEAHGGMLKSTDGGNSWLPLANGLVVGDVGTTMDFVDPQYGYAGYNYAPDYDKTSDSGVIWQRTATNVGCSTVLKVRFINDSVGYILCNDRITNDGDLRIFKTYDYAVQWQQISFLDIHSLGDFEIIGDSTIFILAQFSVYKSTDDGDTFIQSFYDLSEATGFTNFYPHNISFVSPDTGYMAFDQVIYRTYDAGSSWVQTAFPASSGEIFFIDAISSQKIVVGGWDSIYITTTGGGVAAGISEVKTEPMMSVFPNPVSNTLFFKNQLDADNYSINVFNIYGQIVYSTQNYVTSIDVTGFPGGVYILQYKADNYTGNAKFIKQ